MSTALVQRSVSFYGDELVAIQQGEAAYTPVKPVCDILGIDWESQRERIQSDDVLADAAQTITLHLPGDARAYPRLCLPLDYLHGWLFGVNGNLIRPELRERLVLYKRECYRALSRAFSGGQIDVRGQIPGRHLRQGSIDVLAALRDLGGRGRAEDVRAKLPDAHRDTVRRRLSRLALRGVLYRCALGLYELQEA